MNKLILKLTQAALLLAAQLVSSQEFTGQAIYEMKATPPPFESDSKIEISDEFQKEIAAQIKRQMEKTFTLNFNKSESSWEEQQKLEAPQPSSSGISIKIMDSGDSKRYNNLKTMLTMSEEDVFGKEFLVRDSLPKWQWQMTGETKKIGNYTCHKAVAVVKVTKEEREEYEKSKAEQDKNPKRILIIDEPQDYEVTAWYTPEIPVGHGPEGFWGLPGLILETNDGRRTILCSKIVINPKEKIAIYKPKSGEKVTRKQFEEIQEKKMKEFSEMPQERGNGERRVIRIGG